jgi:predicted Zn-dependent protease
MHRPAALAAAAAFSVNVAAITLISVSQEIALGREAQKQVKVQVPELTDRATRDYVASVGRRLAQRVSGPKYPYSFSIANYRELNAFALPGGPVWIHRGIIHAAASEAQLAGVVAHEVAHIAQRHAADQITKRLVTNGALGLLGAILGNDGGARAAQVGAQVLAGGYMLKFSRDDEREADRVGAQIMRRAGWDPRAMAEFMEALRREQGRDPGSVEVFLSSHPAPGERAAALRKLLGKNTGGRRDSAEFQQIKRRVRGLPSAKPMPRR